MFFWVVPWVPDWLVELWCSALTVIAMRYALQRSWAVAVGGPLAAYALRVVFWAQLKLLLVSLSS